MSTSGFRGATNTGDSYERSDYGGRGKFGPREAGSVVANAPLVGFSSAFAYAAEAAAAKYAPGAIPLGMAGVSAWILQMVVWLAFKAFSAWLRNYGGSLLRDLGAWAWEAFLAWFSGRRDRRRDDRRKRRRDRDDRPSPDDDVSPRPRRRRWFWFSR